jgi:hypothetical protein
VAPLRRRAFTNDSRGRFWAATLQGVTEDDWRLTWEEDWMYGARLERRTFSAPTPDWDHEHCVLCQEKFMEPPHDALRQGLVWKYDRSVPVAPLEQRIAELPEAPKGFITSVEAPTEEQWICETCFADFAGRFGWTASDAADGR